MDTLELVLHLSNGAALVPLKRAAAIIGREAQTLRNQLSLGKCPLAPVRMGRSLYFRADDLAKFIDQGREKQPGRGRPSKEELATRVPT
jgi:hypothetical protein